MQEQLYFAVKGIQFFTQMIRFELVVALLIRKQHSQLFDSPQMVRGMLCDPDLGPDFGISDFHVEFRQNLRAVKLPSWPKN